MVSNQEFCLRWNNHTLNFISMFEHLLRTESFTDVTLAVSGGATIKCHKVVLAACSSYFQDLFIKNPCDHPILILGDVNYSEMKTILDYIYRGEVNVAQEQLPALLKIASFLKVKGLVDERGLESQVKNEVVESSPPPNIIPISTAQTNGYVSPADTRPIYVPYAKSPVDKNYPALWTAFPGLPIPQQPSPVSQPLQRPTVGSSYENVAETSPLSRKKQSIMMANRDTPILRNVLGGDANSNGHDRLDNSCCSSSNGSLHESDRRNSADITETTDDQERHISLRNSKLTTTKSGAPKEWKRYKQYTREHIQNAMNAVATNQLSALKAAQTYGVPSRTLYDKLKKAGILASRNASNQRRNSAPTAHRGSARFPYSPSVNGQVYGNSAIENYHANGQMSEDENDESMNGVGSVGGGSENGSTYNTYQNGANQDPEDVVMDMRTRSPSPAGQVEDLSVRNGRAADENEVMDDRNMTTPPPLMVALKEDEQSDNNDSASKED